jgi:hypothetical protein
MKCLCAGSYPSIEQQAHALRADADMPRWPLETYRVWVEAINFILLGVLIDHYRQNGRC